MRTIRARRSRLFLAGILAMLIVPAAFGVHAIFGYQSGNTTPQGLRSVSVYTPGAPFTNGQGFMVTGDRIPGTTDTNGLVTISNLYGGVLYLAVLQGTFKTTSNYYQFPVTNGLINAADYVTNMPSASTGGGAYTAAQSDARYIANRNGFGTNASAVSNFSVAVPGLATNTFTFTNKVVYALGEDTNYIYVTGAGTASANSTNKLAYANIPAPGHIVYTNVLGPNFPSVVRNPDLFYSDNWAITNTSGVELYGSGDGPNAPPSQWVRTGGANPVPTVTYGYTTNSFTNFTSTFNLPWPVSQTNILYVSPLGNDYNAARGDPTRAWKHVTRAWTNMLYQYDVMCVMPGVFDETREIITADGLSNNELPANCAVVGSGRGVSRVVGSGPISRLYFGSSNRLEHISFETIQIYAGNSSHNTNFLCYDVEAHCDGDVWTTSQSPFVVWDPFIVDCDFSGNSDKIAVLTFSTTTPQNTQTNSRIYLINTRISGGNGQDGDGMNRGFTTPDGVRAGQFVTIGTHVMVTGKTNSYFMGLQSQVSTSGTFTATSKVFTPVVNVSGLTASKVVIGNSSKDLASTTATSSQTIAGDGTPISFGSGLVLNGGTLTTNGQTVVNFSYTLTFSTIASGNPSASTTYYFGMDTQSAVQTTYANASVKIPRAGTLKGAYVKVRIGGTTASGETVNSSIRINDTTDVSIPTSTWNAATVDITTTSLNQSVSAGDTFVLKIATPAWGTLPTTVRLMGYIYIE